MEFNIRLFVYGTLKKGNSNNYLLGDSKLLGEAETEEKYTLYSNGHFPILATQGEKSVIGEVYEVTDKEVFDDICTLEGYEIGGKNNWYELEEIETPYGKASVFVQNVNKVNKQAFKIENRKKW